jgi:hypothetical protein
MINPKIKMKAIDYQLNKVKYHLTRLQQLGLKPLEIVVQVFEPKYKDLVINTPYPYYIQVVQSLFTNKVFGYDDLERACNEFCREAFNQLGDLSTPQQVFKQIQAKGFFELHDALAEIHLGIYTKTYLDTKNQIVN